MVVRPWSLFAILNFSPRGQQTQRHFMEKMKELCKEGKCTVLRESVNNSTDFENLKSDPFNSENFFFLSGFSFTTIHDPHDSMARGRLFLYLLSATSTNFTDYYTAESSPLRVASSRT